MLNFFRRKSSPKSEYVLLARYRTGDWMKQFTVEARNAYTACREFDQSDSAVHWIRVSGATIK